jgi:hypothetical protein
MSDKYIFFCDETDSNDLSEHAIYLIEFWMLWTYVLQIPRPNLNAFTTFISNLCGFMLFDKYRNN